MKTTYLFLIFIMPLSAYSQNVGIGTLTPSAPLEVVGTIKATNLIATTGLQITNNPGVNKVLISDASGNATWVAANTIPGSISSSGFVQGLVGASAPAVANVFQFIGSTVTLVLNGSQRVSAVAIANLGRTVSGTNLVRVGIGYQLQPSGTITNIGVDVYCRPAISANEVQIFKAIGSIKPAAGTYKFGFIVSTSVTNYFNLNDGVNFTYSVINE